jgi:hypothetical protein
MWNVKATVIPVIIGRLELLESHSDINWATYRESKKLRNVKKTAILCTVHILRKVLT